MVRAHRLVPVPLLLLAWVDPAAAAVVRHQGGAELVPAIPLKQPTVVFSTPITATTAGDQLVIRLQLGVTNEIADQGGDYTGRVQGKVILATDAAALDGPVIASFPNLDIPRRMHHGLVTVRAEYPIGGELGYTLANLVVESATNGNEPTNCIDDPCRILVDPGDGRLDILQITGSAATVPETNTNLIVPSIPCPEDINDALPAPFRSVVFSHPLTRLEKGEILDVVGHITASATFNGYDTALVSGYIIVAGDPTALEGIGPRAAVQHGFNLYKNDPNAPNLTTAEFLKSGTYEAAEAIEPAYLNLIMRSGAGCDPTDNDAKIYLDGPGSLDVIRYPVPIEGGETTDASTGSAESTSGQDDTGIVTTGDADPTAEPGGTAATGNDPPDATTTLATPTEDNPAPTTSSSSSSSTTAPEQPDDPGDGCGCTNTPARAPAWALPLLLGLRRRRPRR